MFYATSDGHPEHRVGPACERTAMRTCWAASVGGCGGPITGEHPISRCLFNGPEIAISGMPWCLDSEKVIPLAAFTANILCQKHNNGLSDVDAAGKAAKETLQEFHRVSSVRRTMKRRIWPVQNFAIDGGLLERWFVKATINLFVVAGKGRRWHLDGSSHDRPPDVLVAAALGRTPLAPPLGLHVAARVGQDVRPAEGFRSSWYFDRDNQLVATRYEFLGFDFVIWLSPLDPKSAALGQPGGKVDAMGTNLLRHLAGISYTQGHVKALSLVLDFDW